MAAIVLIEPADNLLSELIAGTADCCVVKAIGEDAAIFI